VIGASAFVAAISVVLCGATFQAASQLPIGYWNLDDASSPAVDSIAAANGNWNGTLSLVTTGLPVFSYPNAAALKFTDPAAADNYVQIANSAALDTVQMASYSISAWFNPASVPPGTGSANNANYAVVVKPGWHEGIIYDSAQAFEFQHWTVDASNNNIWSGTGTWGKTYPPGSWYHVVVVWDQPGGFAQIWINGTMIQQATAPPAPAANNRDFGTAPWYIGIAGPGFGNYRWQANGAVDEVRIYNYNLNAAQVGVLAAGVPAPTGLTASSTSYTEIDLSWTYTYTVQRRPTGTMAWTTIATGVTGTTYQDTSVMQKQSYDYQVIATSVATSGPSNIATGTTIPLPPSTGSSRAGTKRCGCAVTGAPDLELLGAALATAGILLLLRRRAA
jgi:MYXO-CTERM domain-containing protein